MRKFEDERIFMNTRVKITVISKKGTVFTQEKILQAFDKFDYIVKNFSRFDPKSKLSELNRSQGKIFKTDKELFNLIEYSLKLAKETGGLYDPTITDFLELYGFTKESSFKNLNSPLLLTKVKKLLIERKKYSEIIIDKNTLTVTLQKGQKLDLGGIGKGYAIDLASDILEIFDSFIINAGGDIKCKGKNEFGKKWKIGLHKSETPNKEIPKINILGTINLTDMSICSSGGWARRIKFFHHLIDIQTGLPKNDVSQSFVIAKKAMDADAWSTALFLMGKNTLKLLEKNKVEGLLIMTNGDILKTDGFNYKKIE